MSKNDKAELGFEAKLLGTANKLRSNMDAAEYKHVVLGLIFLKYVSDSFEVKHKELESQASEGADPEDPDEYRSENIFWVPEKARWGHISSQARQPSIGKTIDDAMLMIEDCNQSLVGILPKDYARPLLDQAKLGEVVDLIGTISLSDDTYKSKDVLGRVYEYFLGEFAVQEGKKGGQFYTPRSIVRLLVAMLQPTPGSRIYDPCCGSGGMFVQSEEFIKAHGGRIGDVSIYGQESNPTTWRLAKMNLAIRGIDNNLANKNADTFLEDQHPQLKADFIIANPPFNMKSWGQPQLRDDKRWRFGIPPENNANFAWVQHMISHLSSKGTAGFVLSNGSLTSDDGGEGIIRQRMIEEGIVDCIIQLPDKMFYTTGISACLWFISMDKKSRTNESRDKILFISAKRFGMMIDRTHRAFSDEDIEKISSTYQLWKNGSKDYSDVAGFCKSSILDDVKKVKYHLTPGRFVGLPPKEEDETSFDEEMKGISNELSLLFKESHALEDEIKKKMGDLGYDIE